MCVILCLVFLPLINFIFCLQTPDDRWALEATIVGQVSFRRIPPSDDEEEEDKDNVEPAEDPPEPQE